jgi:hypothetical protein
LPWLMKYGANLSYTALGELARFAREFPNS